MIPRHIARNFDRAMSEARRLRDAGQTGPALDTCYHLATVAVEAATVAVKATKGAN